MEQNRLHLDFNALCCKLRFEIEHRARLILAVAGVMLLYSGMTDLAHAGQGTYSNACDGILGLVEGSFGSLVTAGAGIGAIIASAVGGFKAAWTLLVVAVGSFILRSYITLFNGNCDGGPMSE